MPAGLSTVFARALPDRERSPERVIDEALRLGAAALVLDAGLAPALYEGLAPLCLSHREVLPVWALECPCPWTRAASAELSAAERDEAEAASKAAEETIARAGELGAPLVVLRLGEVASLRREWPAVRRAFLRGALDAATVQRLLDERIKRAPPHLDAARRSLERLSRAAERHAVTLGLRNPPRALGVPSPGELARLRAELAGAPIAPCLDVAAAHLDDVMGIRPLAAVVEAWQAAPLALVADACGPVVGLPPGRGEIDFPSLALPEKARRVFHPSAQLSLAEVAEGLARVATAA